MKKKILLTIILMGVLFPFNVNALTGRVTLTCGKDTLLPGESTTCVIKGITAEEVTTVSAKVKVGNNITLNSVAAASIWEGNGDGGNIELYTDSNKSGTFDIASFSITAGNVASKTSVSVDSIYLSDASFEQFSISSVSKEITISVPEEPDDGDDPVVTPPTDEPENPEGGDDPVVTPPNDEPEEEDKPVVVPPNDEPEKPEDGDDPVVEEPEIKSNDASLKNITLDVDGFEFNVAKLEYYLEVSNNKEKITIDAVASDSKANIILPNNLDLNVGDNLFEIKVTAEDGTVKVYKINIKRLEENLSDNAYLSSLSVGKYSIKFDKEVTKYTIDRIEESSLDLKVKTEDPSATYEILGNKNLKSEDKVIIKVKAQDGTVKEYIILVKEVVAVNLVGFLIIIFIVFIILLLLLYCLILIMRKRNKKDNDNLINDNEKEVNNVSLVTENEPVTTNVIENNISLESDDVPPTITEFVSIDKEMENLSSVAKEEVSVMSEMPISNSVVPEVKDEKVMFEDTTVSGNVNTVNQNASINLDVNNNVGLSEENKDNFN